LTGVFSPRGPRPARSLRRIHAIPERTTTAAPSHGQSNRNMSANVTAATLLAWLVAAYYLIGPADEEVVRVR